MTDTAYDTRLVAAVADATAATAPRIWGFGVGGTLTALLRAGDALHRPDLTQRVIDLVAPSLTAPPDPTDHLIAVEALLPLAARRPDLDVTDACRRWLAAVRHARPAHPGGPRLHRPDLPPWSSTVWVDCMHTDGPGLAALGHPDEAVAYATEYAAALQLPSGLFQHGYDAEAERGNGVAWGRGQAWALIGLTETLVHAPDDGLARRLTRLVDALAAHERDGEWSTVVDDPDAPVEASTSAYLAWVVPHAIDAGLVDPAHRAMADRAWHATLRRLDAAALTVSEATPVGAANDYHHRALGVFPWGQAPVLHAVLDRTSEEIR
ncbi:glycoside hydrolase family 88 protein [Micromonospora sp. WMMD812]|uniref:glycoside hydrolase family 88 protein n=1 Tax=Micromonospora sp. WMMD812 TaxID=3015152 RepID=UPI00248CF716|nr:glycoside hydrolase family 88 protein [Micromonospora sp. WMMD812]WBB69391.1 glycoside hydrolase family 88 protein [Micromonospora sp. WMMD812]